MALAIIVVILTWIGCMAIIKWIWTPVERRFGYMVEKREPISKEKQELVNADASASLPSSLARQWKYDVFLSFRGPDTRKGITYELYDRLQNRRGIKTFMDDQDLQVGDVISPTLLRAIEESRFAIVVLSEKYAHSTWCLEELTKICQCMEDNNRILPLFYNVDPTDVRYQKRSFEEAFTNHENSRRHRSEKIKQWRDALNKVAHFSGWDSKKYKTERELVEDIVESMYSKVQPIEIKRGDFVEFEATRQAMNKVMKALKDDGVSAIGVYGMGGVGKTTMVKHVSDHARKNGIFHHVIMAIISQSPDLMKIQGTLADLLGVELKEGTEIGRAARLNKEIMRREKILIILDDVWNRIELSDIGIPSYIELQNCNSKVLLTTRIWNVCHAMRCQEKITLNVLSKDDSWTLFVRNARSFESTKFEDVARRVAGECCGLPIALIAVARALGDKDLVEWERAAQRLEKSQTANFDDKGDASECIKLSYNYLKDEDSKSCFLLCCLFPEDYDIHMEDLFRYAIGKGLFRYAETVAEARGKADSIATHLKHSSLLLDSEINGCVRMHDVIRDTAMNIAKSEDGHGFLVKAGSSLRHWPYPLLEGYSAISLMKNKICRLPEELVCPKLQILLLQGNADLNEIPEKFIQSPNELRVLDLSLTSILSLPQSFSLLTNLQALYLDFCKKRIDISIIGKLTTLKILSMRGYPVKELSRELWREVGHLTNLRMLDVSGVSLVGGGIVTIPSKVISKLYKLEELYMLYCGFEDWGSQGEGEGEETNIGFDELTGLSNLKSLQVCISDAKCIPKKVQVEPNWVYFDIRIDGCTSNPYKERDLNSRRSLSLNTTISTLPDWFVDVVIKKTEKLLYEEECKGLSNILMEYDHGRLDGLKHLSVCGPNKNLKELMNTTTWAKKKRVFENLEELHLSRLEYLKEFCVGELPSGSLFNLKLLRVCDCPNLGNVLLPSKLMQRLPNLEIVYLYRIFKLEYVFGCEGFEPDHSKLRELTLLALDAVRKICYGHAPRAMFQTLKSLFIFRCKSLGSLFTFDAADCLLQLEDLWVENCPLLERVIEASKETVNNKKIVLPKLKNLVLKELSMLYSGSASVDIECPSLEHLYVKNCPHLSFPTSASDYFHSRNQIQPNDKQQYDFLYRRVWTLTLDS